jgi:hypothetical protein
VHDPCPEVQLLALIRKIQAQGVLILFALSAHCKQTWKPDMLS